MRNEDTVIAFPLERRVSPAGAAAPGNALADVIQLTGDGFGQPGGARGSRNDALTSDEVRLALDEGRIQLHYQPQFDLCTGRILAVEALVRILGTDGQLIYPDRFIKLIERGDLAVDVGRAIIDHALSDLKGWRAKGQIERVAVNVSAGQLETDAGFVDYLDDALKSRGLEYHHLEVELVERERLAPKSRANATLVECAARGARIVLDDFGTGYSSLMYLAQLPVSAIKIDRDLTARILSDAKALQTLEAILNLGRGFGLDVVVEGIETDDQRGCVTRSGGVIGQGFGLARPMGRAALERLMAQQPSVEDAADFEQSQRRQIPRTTTLSVAGPLLPAG